MNFFQIGQNIHSFNQNTMTEIEKSYKHKNINFNMINTRTVIMQRNINDRYKIRDMKVVRQQIEDSKIIFNGSSR
jgi:hypothetical protein